VLTGLRGHAFGEPAPIKKKRAASGYQESKEQMLVVQRVRENPNVLIMRLENAQKRKPQQADRDKAMGLHPGAPDLVLACGGRIIFIEMKDPDDGEVSEVQAECHRVLRAMGHTVIVGYGYDDAIQQLERDIGRW
jgi:hypothetical protein